MGGIQNYPAGGGYGKTLKNDYRRYAGAQVYFAGRGEMVPNDKSYCEIDPTVKDKYGIPVLRFHWQWTDHEYNQVRHMQQTFRALIEQMGGKVFSAMPQREKGYGIARGGEIIHELGTTRMSRIFSRLSRASSVLPSTTTSTSNSVAGKRLVTASYCL